MPILSMYDVTGIQNYIFSSNKLKENLGASYIVFKIMEKTLLESVNEALCLQKLLRKDTPFETDFSINPVQIIYIGGGNAMLAFDNEENARKVANCFSKKVIEKTAGMLNVAITSKNVAMKDFTEDKKLLMIAHNENKKRIIKTTPLLNTSVTKEAATDGLPAYSKNEDNVDISKSAKLKRDEFKNFKFNELIPDKYSSYIFEQELDKLLPEEENRIAVVHIDGNNMGIVLNNLAEKYPKYEDAVNQTRDFSTKIDELYKNTMKATISILQDKINSTKNDGSSKKLLLRPVVVNGDDITFIVSAPYALSLTEFFLNEIEKAGKAAFPEANLTACGGICIVNKHFPFHRAYQMAEELCKIAKDRGKSQDGINVKSWIDFHVVMSGITDTVSSIRQRYYNIPGLEKHSESGVYHLAWRPWCVSENSGKYDFKHFKDIYKQLQKLPKNKLIDLRNTLASSKEDTIALLNQLTYRGYKLSLPEYFNSNSDFFVENCTPFFDVLEMLDFYKTVADKE